MADRELTIKVSKVIGEKKNKKGEPFISVGDGKNWWYVDKRPLFSLFAVGEEVRCIVNTDNDFKRIVNVVDDADGMQPKPEKSAAQEILELVKENNEMLKDLTFNLAELDKKKDLPDIPL